MNPPNMVKCFYNGVMYVSNVIETGKKGMKVEKFPLRMSENLNCLPVCFTLILTISLLMYYRMCR